LSDETVIQGIANGEHSRLIEAVCRWKSARRIGLRDLNTDAETARALNRAINAAIVP
jgi:hypothetical protein